VERAPSWSWAAIDGPVSYDLGLVASSNRETLKIHSVSVLPFRMDAKYGSVRSGGLICVSSLITPVKFISDRGKFGLTDNITGASIFARLYLDAIEDDQDSNSIIYAFNFYLTESLLLHQGLGDLPCKGLLLVHVRERYYRRNGLYDARDSSWFRSSSLETIYIL
jgi:hypothetical protein